MFDINRTPEARLPEQDCSVMEDLLGCYGKTRRLRVVCILSGTQKFPRVILRSIVKYHRPY